MGYGTQKPPVGAQVNDGHPRAQRLLYRSIFNEGAGAILVDGMGRQNAALSGTYNRAPTGINFGGGNALLGSQTILERTGDFSFSCRLRVTNTTLSVPIGFYGGAGSYGWGLGYSISTAGKPDFWSNGAGAWRGCPTAINDGLPHTICVSVTGVVGTWFVDGRNVGTFVHATPSYATPGFAKRIGSVGDGSSPFSGVIEDVSVWHGQTHPTQAAVDFTDPYAMYQPSRFRTYSIPTASGAALLRRIMTRAA